MPRESGKGVILPDPVPGRTPLATIVYAPTVRAFAEPEPAARVKAYRCSTKFSCPFVLSPLSDHSWRRLGLDNNRAQRTPPEMIYSRHPASSPPLCAILMRLPTWPLGGGQVHNANYLF